MVHGAQGLGEGGVAVTLRFKVANFEKLKELSRDLELAASKYEANGYRLPPLSERYGRGGYIHRELFHTFEKWHIYNDGMGGASAEDHTKKCMGDATAEEIIERCGGGKNAVAHAEKTQAVCASLSNPFERHILTHLT